MKKRVVSKQNKKFFNENILDPIKKAGLKLKFVKFLDGYFIFSRGTSSVLHFIFEDLPFAKFGVWRNFDGQPYVIFGDDIASIDKFKPTQTHNFTLDELITLIKDYKSGKITWRYITTELFDHVYEREYPEDGPSYIRDVNDEEWMNIYMDSFIERQFEKNNSWITREEYKIMNAHKEKMIKELCASPYITHVFFRRTPDFAFDYGSIEVCYSSKCDELTQEEFDKLDRDIEDKVRWVDPTAENPQRSYICYNEWRALAHVESDTDLHKIIYKGNGKKKKLINNLTMYK